MKSKAITPLPQTHRAPTRAGAAIFRAKAAGLQMRRAWRDKGDSIRRYPRGEINAFPVIWSQSRTPLWSDETLAERALQIGKVQNLRAAMRHLGCAIPASQTWSFWKQIARATMRRGFVAGRLLREGCLMPAVGGGLCQLSNALYDAALQANLEIIERHAHTQIVPGSFAQNGRDATVAWNYVDLRFRATQDFFIEGILTRDELIVRLRGRRMLPQKVNFIAPKTSSETRGVLDVMAHSCASCGQTSCFLHARRARHADEKTAWLLDAAWPEFQKFLTQNYASRDELLIPINGARWNVTQYRWSTPCTAPVRTATVQTLLRGFTSRRHGKSGATRLQSQLRSDAAIAQNLARQISHDATHLVVAQSLLPFLWREGVLSGRTFDVFYTRLPLHVLHARLDAVFAAHPDRETLGEFRAPSEIVECEKAALAAATRIISPHFEIVQLFPADKVLPLPWQMPPSQSLPSNKTASRLIGFPGSTASRKGAFELREVARELGLEIVLRGAEIEGENFWDGVKIRRANSSDEFLDHVAVVVQPAIVEENPRLLLRAMARGIPVIATPACGLGESEGVIAVAPDDVRTLREAIENVLASQIDISQPAESPC